MPPSKDLSLANRLIASLPSRERSLFFEESELVELKVSMVLTEAGHAPTYAYFPVDGFVSLSLPMAGKPNAELTLVGNEGMFSTSTALGVSESAFTCTVQGAGRFFCIHQTQLQHLLAENVCLNDSLKRYVHACLSCLALQAACVNLHSIEQRSARWLLMTRDRADSSEIFLTHDTLAVLLGVRRESVTRAAGALQRYGLISYGRGYLVLLDESRLEGVACPCYLTDLQLHEDALSRPPHACHTP